MENLTFDPLFFAVDSLDVSEHFVARSVPLNWLRIEKPAVQNQVQGFFTKLDDDGEMTISALVGLAKTLGINKPENIVSKVDLIRAIQTANDHQPCYRTDQRSVCKNEDCGWRQDCKKMLAEWCR